METGMKLEGGIALDVVGALAAAHEHEVTVTARVLPSAASVRFKIPETAPLLQLLKEGARQLGVDLLPPAPQQPLDQLHNLGKHDLVGPAIDDLQQPVGEYLKAKETTKDFGIEMVLAFRVNTRWTVAPKPQMTPREILALPAINLDPSQYTLYASGSANALPLDTPVAITRGMAFEAQRDGKYGGRS